MPSTTYMLDTQSCSHLFRQLDINMLAIMDCILEAGDKIVMSANSYQEVEFAIKRCKNEDNALAIENLINEFYQRIDSIVTWDSKAVDTYVSERIKLELIAPFICTESLKVAAHAITHGHTLLTLENPLTNQIENLKYKHWTGSEKQIIETAAGR
ncbi:type II toxin-antitoxin system VapC family toxin [Vibrio parahaemolyticus]|nr:type II toxin-antitoxin system VapC family toxin [Vibrio parahaemolyticus]